MMSDDAIAPTPENFWLGIHQFNRGEFYACHDTLEAIWMHANPPEKGFYQGILQIAVALYHLRNGNWQGAATLMGEGIRRLEPFEPAYRNIDVTDLLDRADAWLNTLQQLGPEQIEPLQQRLQGNQSSVSATLDPLALPTLQIRHP